MTEEYLKQIQDTSDENRAGAQEGIRIREVLLTAIDVIDILVAKVRALNAEKKPEQENEE